MNEYYAHSEVNGKKETVMEHLCDVARLSSEFASVFGCSWEAQATAMLHDIGKYSDLFKRRLEGKEKNVDHWTCGAEKMLMQYKCNGIAGALAIQGHHIGLQKMSEEYLRKISVEKIKKENVYNLKLPEKSIDEIMKIFTSDNGSLPDCKETSKCLQNYKYKVDSMLDVRMLYSVLTDADFISTESHFDRDKEGNRVYRKVGKKLEPGICFEKLEEYMIQVKKESKASEKTKKIRDDLYKCCIEKGNLPKGIYTLSAPTGSGKTLSILAFALKHAIKNNMRRIIVVMPYLNIIEQNSGVYKKVFKDLENDNEPLILEDHSLARIDEKEDDNKDKENIRNYIRKYSENWDAPIIVTTTVKFFESLFSNSPSQCRKLHNIADSIIIFDEAQTLPLKLAIPTLGALSHLCSDYGCSIIFSTATQPAFNHLNSSVEKFSKFGWESKELVENDLNLFGRSKKVKVIWPQNNERMSLIEVAEEMAEKEQVLCIVNTKKQARGLFKYIDEILNQEERESLYFISTDMCIRHRKKVLHEIKALLKAHKMCRVVATQCVEAGVDFDFPNVYRVWGPLEAIAQAAGRCNRDGNIDEGFFKVFMPIEEEEKYPEQDGYYKQASQVAKLLFNESNGYLDINDPKTFDKYYKKLFVITNVEGEDNVLKESIITGDFIETDRNYKIINNNTINLIVPYKFNENDNEYENLMNEIKTARKMTSGWLKRARMYSVSYFRPSPNSRVLDNVEKIIIGFKNPIESPEWFFYVRPEHYNEKTGLFVPEEQDFLNV